MSYPGMAGYAVLNNETMEYILTQSFADIEVVEPNPLCRERLKYCIETIKGDYKILVILTPIQQGLGSALASLRANIPEFRQQKDRFHVLAGVVGNGVTERHIVSMYMPPNGDIHFFDPKASDPQKFFSDERGFNWRRLLPALWNALSSRPQSSFTLHDGQEETRPAVHSALGTQSFFDGVSCGYHHASQLLALRELIKAGKAVTVDGLLGKLKNPVSETANKLGDSPYKALADNHFFSFMKKAWLDTYLPGLNGKARQTLHFGHYFMGWPSKKGIFRKVVYVVTLGFIVNPLINAIKLPELLANGLSESFSFLKNQLITWAPTHPATQFLRSGLLLSTLTLQGLFKGLYFAIRTVTSPITSFKEAWRIHPALGILSAVVSLAAYAALVYFAAPVIVPMIMAASPAAAPAFNALAYPLVQLFGLMGLSLTTATAAAGTLTLGAVLLQAGKLLLNKLIDGVEKSDKKAVNHSSAENQVLPKGSNVEAAFKKSPEGRKTRHTAEDDFKYLDPAWESADSKEIDLSPESSGDDFEIINPAMGNGHPGYVPS
ncbi:hypothetical protein [Legionella erythra]|nr:hypothetical protein [Legionella erythra]